MGFKPWWDTLAWAFITHWFFLFKSSIHISGMSACLAGPCNLTEWKDLKQKIMAGKSHQWVAWVSDCGTDVTFIGRSITAYAAGGGGAISPTTSSPILPPFPPPSLWSTASQSALFQWSVKLIIRLRARQSITIYNTKSNACILSSQCQTSDRTVSWILC